MWQILAPPGGEFFQAKSMSHKPFVKSNSIVNVHLSKWDQNCSWGLLLPLSSLSVVFKVGEYLQERWFYSYLLYWLVNDCHHHTFYCHIELRLCAAPKTFRILINFCRTQNLCRWRSTNKLKGTFVNCDSLLSSLYLACSLLVST